LNAVKNVPVWTQEQLNNYLFFIKGMIAVISESGLQKLKSIESRKQIQESEERASTILQKMSDGFWMANPEDGTILDVNDAMCRMVGYTRDELLKLSIADVIAFEPPEFVRQ
jgi:two-component system cell cycle sensor histidine kinase/response regulator CckA